MSACWGAYCHQGPSGNSVISHTLQISSGPRSSSLSPQRPRPAVRGAYEALRLAFPEPAREQKTPGPIALSTMLQLLQKF